jgi:hypothetical protein
MSIFIKAIAIVLVGASSVSVADEANTGEPNTTAESTEHSAPVFHPLGLTPPTPPVTGIVAPDASASELQRLEQAVGMFESAGLALPAIEVRFHDDTEACKGHAGLYTASRTHAKPDVINICHRLRTIVLHELGHAWEHHNIDDDRRAEFIEAWDLPTWRERGFAWEERGVEQAAHTIAFTLATTAPTHNHNINRFGCSWELLTGTPLPNPEFFDCAS